MVGPNFRAPPPPNAHAYTAKPLPAKTVTAALKGGYAQQFMMGQDIPAQWWTLFHSQPLNDLVTCGLQHNPNLLAAKATLLQAQETLNANVGTLLFPNVTAQFAPSRQRFSNATYGINTPASTFNLYNASVDVTYTLDVFGGSRRQIEALQAQVDYQNFELAAAYLALTANIVTTAITAASYQEQIKATEQIISLEQTQLTIIKRQFTLGSVPLTNVLSEQSELQLRRASLPPLEQNLARAQHALAVLIGSLPSETHITPLNLNQLSLPSQLPISLPSLLVRQRPDVRAQEALWHAASAQVGVATANLFPKFTINADYGWTSNRLAHLFSPNNLFWDYGAQVLQPIFNGGAYRAQLRAAKAAYDVALAQYRATVLQAFQNVADSLRAIQNDAKTLQAQRLAEIAAARSLTLNQQQYKLGGSSLLLLLTAQSQYQQALIGRIQAQAARYADTAALFQALGGGWWQHNQPIGN